MFASTKTVRFSILAVFTSLSIFTVTFSAPAGAENVTVKIDREVKTANIENRTVFVEANIFVEASGRPRISKS